MSSKSYIKTAIKKFAYDNSLLISDYSNWVVGITANLSQRLSTHGSPKIWRGWETTKKAVARDIEKHFLDMGMKGGTGGGKNPTFVYIFKKTGPYT